MLLKFPFTLCNWQKGQVEFFVVVESQLIYAAFSMGKYIVKERERERKRERVRERERERERKINEDKGENERERMM